MEKNDIYILNPSYIIKNDKKRFFLTNNKGIHFSDDVNTSFLTVIHPIHAMLFSFFNGKDTLEISIKKISTYFDISQNKVEKILVLYIENKKEVTLEYEGMYYEMPKKLIIKNSTNEKRNYKPEDFIIESEKLDLNSSRLYSPLDTILVVNTTCLTDCIYCYANRKQTYKPIAIEKLINIIRDARKIGMRNFDISGGEIFLYKKWDILLTELINNGFMPYISTKVPIGLETIKKLKNLGINEIQISIDSLNPIILKKMLNVSENYRNQIVETIKNLDKENFKIKTNTIITNINSKTSDLKDLITFLSKLNNIEHINISPAGHSLYKTLENYNNIKPKIESLNPISELVQNFKKEKSFNIGIDFNGFLTKGDFINDEIIKKEKFVKRSKCTANIENFIILPDGKVTICEDLYWHPAFIIGDLTKQSIEEVWNSEKALNLYNLSQDKIQNSSACKTCNDFESCHKIRGVCWKFVLEAYGEKNWDFPDPRCPYAPKPFNVFWIE